MNSIPLPVSEDSFRSRMRNWDDAAAGYGTGRTLESAAITEGNLRVVRGGNIIIGSGGNLEIVDGNLILGEGKIEGNALQDQLQATQIYKPNIKPGWEGTTSWQHLIAETVQKPFWANNCIIQLAGSVATEAKTFGGDFIAGLEVNGVRKITAASSQSWVFEGSDGFGNYANLFFTSKESISSDALRLSLSAIARSAGENKRGSTTASLTGTVIWTR